MTTIAERTLEDELSAKQLGRQLRQVRLEQGLSRADVARSAGLTRRELAAYERGRVHVPESDLWCLAGSCGVEVSDLLPHRDELRIDAKLASAGAPAEPGEFAVAIEGSGRDAVDDFFATPRGADPVGAPELAAPIAWRAPALVAD